ncbi:MAG TPA: SET domain-containing protein, partial [Myxococcota bacterium]|nr:SET domain-containing protein [Myxococcota bacterium]
MPHDIPPIDTLWDPHPGVDAPARAAAELRLRSSTRTAMRPDGQVGLFAAQPLPAGVELVHRWHDGYYLGMPGWVVLTLAEIDALPERDRTHFLRYGLDVELGAIVGPVSADEVRTLDNFINHGCDPNLGYDARGSVVTLRAIAIGEELRLDYGHFAANYDEPFSCACGAV